MPCRLAVVLALAFALPLLSQHGPTKTSGMVAPIGLMTPFDQSRTTLGPGFRGHDITAIFRSIQRLPNLKNKGEFETTAAYEERRASFANIAASPSEQPHGVRGPE
jgi:hypothetical protein